MYEKARAIINEKYGSINKLSKAIGVESSDLYAGFAGTKTLFPKYKKLIADALNEDEAALFQEVENDKARVNG